MTPLLRPMRTDDLDAVLAIQLACYGAAFVEDGALIARRLAAAPHTAWVAQQRGRVGAYLAAYPSRLGRITPLNGDFEPAPDADTLYLHDLAVDPAFGGQGLGPALVRHALAQTPAAWRHCALVSVQSSLAFWQRLGYAQTEPGDLRQRRHLASYPGPAYYMVRRLP